LKKKKLNSINYSTFSAESKKEITINNEYYCK
jgi:hypothetical protein